jgi:hypothetical protein
VPPRTLLSASGALGNLNFSDSWLEYVRSQLALGEHVCDWQSFDAHGAGVDLQDGFYQYLVPEMSSWFCLGERYLASEAGVSQVFDDELGHEVAVRGDEVLYACFAGLPMGWSWALFFCQEAVANCGIRAQARLGHGDLPLLDGYPSPQLSARGAVTAPYVDNGNVIGGSRESTQELLDAFKELGSVGFQLHEEVEPCCEFEVLGRVLDFQRGQLRPKPQRVWRLRKALDQIIGRPWMSPDQLRKVLGHLVDLFIVRRECLCCLLQVYRFVGGGGKTVQRLPRAVVDELWCCRALLPLAFQDLRRDAHPRVYCSDSSTKGYALHVTQSSPCEFWAAAKWKERWRFKDVINRVRENKGESNKNEEWDFCLDRPSSVHENKGESNKNEE